MAPSPHRPSREQTSARVRRATASLAGLGVAVAATAIGLTTIPDDDVSTAHTASLSSATTTTSSSTATTRSATTASGLSPAAGAPVAHSAGS